MPFTSEFGINVIVQSQLLEKRIISIHEKQFLNYVIIIISRNIVQIFNLKGKKKRREEKKNTLLSYLLIKKNAWYPPAEEPVDLGIVGGSQGENKLTFGKKKKKKRKASYIIQPCRIALNHLLDRKRNLHSQRNLHEELGIPIQEYFNNSNKLQSFLFRP